MPIGKLHLLILHFPIALILAAALADALWLWRRKGPFLQAGYWCILLGAAASVPAVLTGFLLIGPLGMDQTPLGETHESLGVITMCVALAAAGLRVGVRNVFSKKSAILYGMLVAGAAVLVGLTGHWGGMLAFGETYLTRVP